MSHRRHVPAGCDQDRYVKSCLTLKMKSTVFSLVYYLQNLDTNYSFLYLLSLIICDAFCDFGTCCGTTSSSENVILIDVTN